MRDERALPVDGSVFEALFRVAAPEGALGAKLEALGIALDPGGRRFSAQQWLGALHAYREALFPGPDGFRQLGAALARAFGDTFSGRLILIALPMLSPLQLLRRWPRFVRVGRTDVVLEVVELGERAVAIDSIDPVEVPMELNLGLLEHVFSLLGERPTYEVQPRGPGEARVIVRW
ncbi:MAG: DUF2378 family protein [Myxococcaceae bacterium]